MLTYSIRRILGMIPLLIIISIIVFGLAKMMPGDALTGQIDPTKATPEYLAEMREKLGYNDPIPVQYWNWVQGLIKGDFGQSFIHKLPVSEMIAQRLPNTLLLAVVSLVITYTCSFMMGIYAGRYPNTLGDRSIISLNYVAYAVPSFVASIIAIYVFAIKLGWVPISGSVSIGVEDTSLMYVLSKLKHTILPALVLGLFNTAAYTQFLRNDIIDSTRKDYVRTAMAKGTDASAIYNRHILRNSLIPIVTFFGFDIAGLLGGAVVVETIFVYPGMGSLFINSISNRDYSVVMAVTLLLALMTLLGNLIADLLYGVIDPRIRLS
ncbi:oligopeptide ABC transporter permease [Paenibacillus sp. GCM10027629]|uniref:oligopeptide ABC transporter permease n=1 Tax=Paenibacillus sp. GCM10027629 TaxID=3273414 RepID=UPI00362D9E92